MASLLCAVLLGVSSQIPDYSHSYFPHLQRPIIDQVQMDGEGGPVILIIVDALRPDRLGAYGFQRPTSPNLDRLADDGIILTNFYVLIF